MQLNEEIKKIQKLISELSTNSSGVVEFIDFVEGYPEILNHLKFSTMQDLKDYISDASVVEFDELRDEVNHFVKRRKNYIQSEIDELERASQDLSRSENIDVSVSQLMDLFQQAREVVVPDNILNKLENTECNQIKKGEMKKVLALAKKYNKQDPRELKSALLKGDYRRPLILKFGNRFHLVAGNTRLCTAAAIGIKPKVLIADIDTL